MAEEKSIDACFQYTQDTRGYIEAVEKRHDKEIGEAKADSKSGLAEVRGDHKALVDKMLNRLPPWVTVVISLLTLAVGVLASIAFK